MERSLDSGIGQQMSREATIFGIIVAIIVVSLLGMGLNRIADDYGLGVLALVIVPFVAGCCWLARLLDKKDAAQRAREQSYHASSE